MKAEHHFHSGHDDGHSRTHEEEMIMIKDTQSEMAYKSTRTIGPEQVIAIDLDHLR